MWEKSDGKSGTNAGGGVGGGPLNPLHIGDPHVWKDSPWSTPGDSMLTRPRTFPQPPDTTTNNNGSGGGNTGILR